ncbi:MAG: cyclic nucleotide-binding domain-containing protein, partial [Chitinophagaceae bacterium]|nr:cyclic nucleotide-binding domain-containing protein [Rubrivivax sp.]
MNPTPSSRQHDQDQLLLQSLHSLFGDLGAPALAVLRQELQWVEVAGGQALMHQGEPGDAMFISVSGRLRAYVADDNGGQRMVREMSRGKVIGEMSLFTDEPRSATVVAIRDSVLVRLDKPAFHRLLAASPQVSLALTRQIIHRLQGEQTRSALASPVTIGLLPISDGVDAAQLARQLAAELQRLGRVRVVDAATVDTELAQPGLAETDVADVDVNRRIALLLDHIEAQNDYVLLVGDSEPTPWTQRCSRHCDELLLLADASQPPALHRIETECLMLRPPRTEAAEILLLLH